jgi:hypothetical protein
MLNYMRFLTLVGIFCFGWVQAETHTVIYPSNLYPGLFWEVEQAKSTINQQVFSDYKSVPDAPRYRPLQSEEKTPTISHNYQYRSEIPAELLNNPTQSINDFKPGLEDIRPAPLKSFMDRPNISNMPNNSINYPNTILDPWLASQLMYYNLMRNLPPNPADGNFAVPNLPMDGRFYFQQQSSTTEIPAKPSIRLLSEPIATSEPLSIPVERLFTVPDDWIQAPSFN